jgi:hypothetical protein
MKGRLMWAGSWAAVSGALEVLHRGGAPNLRMALACITAATHC